MTRGAPRPAGRPGTRRPASGRLRRDPYTLFGAGAVAVAALAALGWAVAVGGRWYLGWLLAWSVATFVLYGLDKRAARQGGPRVPEVVLHGLALVGGAAGGWAGMFLFRHKTRHPSFVAVLALASALQVGLGLWLLSLGG
ncbi:MAG TPA: DUF1294 domain-containing protein [Chloroflexota bacterium]|nr:DUF1294 domain-containing protein [Chloroflexota bacterium]